VSAAGDRLRDPRQRAERAAQILDVAAALLIRHGYRRLTVDDVAIGAGIGKGTIYLHWKSRDELFAAVFAREIMRALDALVSALREDPDVVLPSRLARAYFLAIMNRPLLRALVVSDVDLLGRLAKPREGREGGGEDRHRLLSDSYFTLLADNGALREDIGADAIAYAFQATFEGFVRAEAETATPVASRDARSGLARRADLLAATVQRAFEARRAIPARTTNALAERVIELLTQLNEGEQAGIGPAEA
jgi:AcrR family transcriptional regulator